MNCPVCARSLAPTLSICPTCGAMMNDTVREELQTKITPGFVLRSETNAASPPARQPMPPRPAMIASPSPKRVDTAGLRAPKTSSTLVEFQNKNAALPDWRIQLQNAVQRRKGGQNVSADASNNGNQFPTNGGAALRAEVVQPVTKATPEVSDPRVANAMRRIEESRKAFLEPHAAARKAMTSRPASMRPFGVVSPTGNASNAAPALSGINTPPKPKLVNLPVPMAEKRDTNKLPPIERVQDLATIIDDPVIEKVENVESGQLPTEFAEIKRIRIRAETTEIETDETPDNYTDEIEDLAPFSMRFGAGLFDLIIGTFAALLILSPFAVTNGNWFTTAGLLIVAGTTAIVLFLYMTACLGFVGKTMGMRLFSLELVDAVENEYPTIHQAAVNSSVFILSLVFAGAGFLTVLFNEEKRALHDLLSGTILVREF